jgi:hypothetical protein
MLGVGDWELPLAKVSGEALHPTKTACTRPRPQLLFSTEGPQYQSAFTLLSPKRRLYHFTLHNNGFTRPHPGAARHLHSIRCSPRNKELPNLIPQTCRCHAAASTKTSRRIQRRVSLFSPVSRCLQTQAMAGTLRFPRTCLQVTKQLYCQDH